MVLVQLARRAHNPKVVGSKVETSLVEHLL